jgi:NAD(P)H-dependent FMN reductase
MDAMNTPIKIKVIIGTTRQGRFSEKPAQWIYEEAKKLNGVEAELLDLRDYPMPFFESQTSPLMANGIYENEIIQKWAAKIKEGDAFIIVTPEYNHGYPAVLKNAMDVIYPEWNKKPVGFVSYGSAMGVRSVEQLRQVAIELQMAPIRNAIHIPVDIFFAAMMGNGQQGPEMFESIRRDPMGDRVQIFFDDLLWWARVLKYGRDVLNK